MSTFNNHNLICLPAHILDARITPRAREVLMLLASQTSIVEPATWICQGIIAERLRCSVATVARSIKLLVEAKLIAETGELYQGRFKYYHVRWSSDENLKAVTKRITKPVRRVVVEKATPVIATASERSGKQSTKRAVDRHELRSRDDDSVRVPVVDRHELRSRDDVPRDDDSAQVSTLTSRNGHIDSRIAYHAEIARQKHQENLRRYQEMLLSLRTT